jgi:hypothetical protein
MLEVYTLDSKLHKIRPSEYFSWKIYKFVVSSKKSKLRDQHKMPTNYIFHSTCYDTELLKKEEICLKDNNIDYQVGIKKNTNLAIAPMSGHFEAEIRISEADFKKADLLLKDIIKEFS